MSSTVMSTAIPTPSEVKTVANSVRGLIISLGIIVMWFAHLSWAIWFAPKTTLLGGSGIAELFLFGFGTGSPMAFLDPLWLACLEGMILLVGFIFQTWLSTGLFIVAHDAMHGILCARWPRLGHWIGATSVFIYAFFDYKNLASAHVYHHKNPASAQDPDYHRREGKISHPIFWYFDFMRQYVTLRQILGFPLLFLLLTSEYFLHIPMLAVQLFWVLPLIVSTWQLFYAGTYSPHHFDDADPFVDWHQARSVRLGRSPAVARLFSLLSCYHFGGFHLEHHRYPYVPWWMLPRCGTSQQQ